MSIRNFAPDKEAIELEQSIKNRLKPFENLRVKIGITVVVHLAIGGLAIPFFAE